MCCFSQPVTSVNATRIFARLSGQGTQFLVYQMNYESEVPNAMILPIPVMQPASDDQVRFLDLSDYDEFFRDLDSGFPFIPGIMIGCASPDIAVNSDMLKVFNVGNYIASFVPSVTEFDRLDPRFSLSADTWRKIPGYETYGFAVFQLDAGALTPHPIAFEFETSSSNIFFPTVHIHDGEVHELEEFDHLLYAQHAGLDSQVYGYRNSYAEDSSTGMVRSKHRASQFCSIMNTKGIVEGELLVHRMHIRGMLPNRDSWVSAAGDPLKPTFNFRPFLAYTPWLVVLGIVGWIVHRRVKLRMQASETSAADATLST